MKKNDLNSLRQKTVSELKKEADKKRREVSGLIAKIKAGQEKNLKKAKNVKRDIAQISTLIREKELIEDEGKEGKGDEA